MKFFVLQLLVTWITCFLCFANPMVVKANSVEKQKQFFINTSLHQNKVLINKITHSSASYYVGAQAKLGKPCIKHQLATNSQKLTFVNSDVFNFLHKSYGVNIPVQLTLKNYVARNSTFSFSKKRTKHSHTFSAINSFQL